MDQHIIRLIWIDFLSRKYFYIFNMNMRNPMSFLFMVVVSCFDLDVQNDRILFGFPRVTSSQRRS